MPVPMCPPINSHNATPFAIPTIPTTHAPNANASHSTAQTTKQSISELFTAIIRVLVEVFEIREAEIETLCFGLCELMVRKE